MNNIIYILIAFAILLFVYREYLKVNLMVFLIISRGIIAPNKFWWNISDFLLRDASGVKLYRSIKEKYQRKIIPLKFFTHKIHCISDHDFIKQVLDQSPFIFGVGKLKYNLKIVRLLLKV